MYGKDLAVRMLKETLYSDNCMKSYENLEQEALKHQMVSQRDLIEKASLICLRRTTYRTAQASKV